MPNRLGNSNSPYLLQHAENPVDWHPWGEEALRKAKDEDKPIFLSIGYSACHWCHVMAHESFEDAEVAKVMNSGFINIKVDREERPDIDSIYMNAVVAMTGQGGWPLSVFLTPNGEPFFGGTYFPPKRRHNLPSFTDVLLTIERLWREDRRKLLESSQEITQHILRANRLDQKTTPLTPQALEQAAYRLAQSYDWKHGGWGQAPKFPQPMTIEFLLQRASQGDQLALDVARHSLDAMSQGGMYDILGGGFCRYSTDDEWLVPHFEKMLYDNAMLARVYLYAYLITRDGRYREIHEATLDFILHELTSQEGGFYSSLDADSEGEEGKFYLWDFEEIQAILAQEQNDDQGIKDINLVQFYAAAYGLKPEGNFEGRIVLQRVLDEQVLGEAFTVNAQAASDLLKRLDKILYHRRENRVRPLTDDKVILSWNALALRVFAESARYLKREDYLHAARKNALFIQKHMKLGNRLMRTWREGQAQNPAFLEDYAGLIIALIALYQSDPSEDWYRFAHETTESMLELFADSDGNFFDTASDGEPLIMRPRDLQDNATPSGNSLAALSLLQMAAYTGNEKFRNLAENLLSSIQEAAVRYPTAFANWLNGMQLNLSPIKEIAILTPFGQQDLSAINDVIWSSFMPNVFVAVSAYPPPPAAPELVKNRLPVGNRITIFVCKDFVCERPVFSPEELNAILVN